MSSSMLKLTRLPPKKKQSLDYCNSLFRSLSSFHMRKLQCIQNTLGRIVTNCNRYSQACPFLRKLHWLPVKFWCSPKLFQPSSVYLISIRYGRYGTRYNRPDKRFLEVPQFYPSVDKSKNTFVTVLFLMRPHSGMICLMM